MATSQGNGRLQQVECCISVTELQMDLDSQEADRCIGYVVLNVMHTTLIANLVQDFMGG